MNTRWRERERNRKGERQERDEEAAGESEEGMVGERGPYIYYVFPCRCFRAYS